MLNLFPDLVLVELILYLEKMMTMQLCVLGNPVEHSRSPSIHQQFAKQAGLSVRYEKTLVELDQFELVVRQLQQQQFTGCNITVPFKEQAFALADELSEQAKLAKAVNTFIFHSDGRIEGHNTDGLGLLVDITRNVAFSLSGKRLLILGAGGAVRGVLEPLLMENPAELWVANRTLSRAQQLIDEWSNDRLKAVAFNELANEQFDVIIDATSFMGVTEYLPNSLSLSGASLCYDLKFPKQPSPFLQWAGQHKAGKVVDGWGMLVEQAACAFELWTGFKPETSQVLASL